MNVSLKHTDNKFGKEKTIKSDGFNTLFFCLLFLGPLCRLRKKSIIKKNVKIGNFVEVKNSVIGINSKINHLSYIGDSIIGKNSNIGAGTITCNYDGKKKKRTIELIQEEIVVAIGMIIKPILLK